jgi:hypothetical protein
MKTIIYTTDDGNIVLSIVECRTNNDNDFNEIISCLYSCSAQTIDEIIDKLYIEKQKYNEIFDSAIQQLRNQYYDKK